MNEKILANKNAVVIGCTGGVGQSITEALVGAGASVLGVARNEQRLAHLKENLPGIDTLSADATDNEWLEQLVGSRDTDIIVVALGATPHMATLQDQTWQTFARPWDVDMKASFGLCKAALSKPLKPGSQVIIISGGPALGASPLSGGLSPSKWGQLFLAQVAQGQSDKLGLDIQFAAVAPKRMMPSTALGKVASQGYADYLGITVDDFMKKQPDAQQASDVGPAVLSVLTDKKYRANSKYLVNDAGLSVID